jgi:hypothetical protein
LRYGRSKGLRNNETEKDPRRIIEKEREREDLRRMYEQEEVPSC